MSKDFEIYASVCSSLKPKEIENRVNKEMPTGISSKWHISKDKTFKSGEPNPNPCERSKTNKHYLLNC